MISYILSVRQSVRAFFVVLYVGCIAALSLLPPNDLPQIELFRGADKVVHFMMYYLFSILFCWTLKTELNYLRIFFIVFVTVGWGILMEFLQLDMHVGRSFSWYDALANTIGVAFGVLTYILVSRTSAV
jgi:VanZ family protein